MFDKLIKFIDEDGMLDLMRRNLSFIIPVCLCLTSIATKVAAQIVPDNTLGNERSNVVPNVRIRGRSADLINGGARRNNSLFHSFERFNVNEAQRVYFANPAGVRNIFTRVTGANRSNVFGTLGVDGGANLFLVNPNGIIFGQNATLDVNGSFFATTANKINFPDGSQFSATNPQLAPLLTVDPRSIGLEFWLNSGGDIVNRSVTRVSNGEGLGLILREGRTLGLLANNIFLEGGDLLAPAGTIELGAILNGSVTVDLTNNNDLVVGYQGVINSGDIELSRVARVNASSGRNLDGIGVFIRANNLRLIEGARILSDSLANRNAGNIEIEAKAIEIIGTNPFNPNSFSLLSSSVAPNATGNGGNIIIKTDTLRISERGVIGVSSFGRGNAGNIDIKANKIELLNSNEIKLDDRGGLFGQLGTPFRVESGDINIETNILTSDNALISVNTFGPSNSGNINIKTDSLILTNNSDLTAQTGAIGNGGNINIDTNSLQIFNGARVGAGTFGAGNAGDINIKSKTIEITGFKTEDNRSSLSSIVNLQASGNGGNIKIQTDTLKLLNRGQINTSTFGSGNAGNVTIKAKDIDIVGALSLDRNSWIQASAGASSTGTGGNININTTNLNLIDGGLIFAQSFAEKTAGNININTSGIINLKDGTIATASDRASGGKIDITANDLRLVGDSDIVTFVNIGAGSGGNITINSSSIIAFDDSDILAFSRDGSGGNIVLNTPAFFGDNYTPTPANTDPAILDGNDRVDVNASGTFSGLIILPDLSFIENSITELPNITFNTANLIANTCIDRAINRNSNNSSFIVTGSGGLPENPYSIPVSHYPTVSVQGIDKIEENNSSWQLGDPIVEPNGVFRLPNGKLVLTRKCDR